MPLSNVDPSRYDALLGDKTARVVSLLAAYNAPEPSIYTSQSTGFRMRAEFRMWHDGNELDYVMFRRDAPKTPVRIHEFPIACEGIQRLMQPLLAQLKTTAALRNKLFQVEFLSTLSGETLLTLVYHRKLDEQWLLAANVLARALDIQVVGRSRKQKIVLDRAYVTERLTIDSLPYRYHQYEQAFTQPNALVNISMIEWACQQASKLGDDLLELYCGNGNFTLPLAQHFDHVIATELSKASIKAARENLAQNNINNVEMIRLSAEEVSEAMQGTRVFRRLSELSMPLCDYQLNTVFVDPPRAGLDQQTTGMVSDFISIIYISCNPDTLARDVAALHATHKIAQFAVFDQFPYTDHLECGVLLSRR